MNSSTSRDWLDGNQRCLMAAVEVVRAWLEARLPEGLAGVFSPENTGEGEAATVPQSPSPDCAAEAGHSGVPEGEVGPGFSSPPATPTVPGLSSPPRPSGVEIAEAALGAATAAMPAPSALETLCTAFQLSVFERSVLVLCAGMELSSDFAAFVASLPYTAPRRSPTFGLALTALPEAHWSALTPDRPLRRWRLIELLGSDGPATSPLRIDERILHYLTGVDTCDERLQALLQPVTAFPGPPESQLAIAQRLVTAWSTPAEPGCLPVAQLCAGDPVDKRSVAALACHAFGLRLRLLRQSDLPAAAADRMSLARLWEREAVLSRSALLIEADEADEADGARQAASFIESVHGIVVLSRREPVRLRDRPLMRLDVPSPDAREQTALWTEALGEQACALNGDLGQLVSQFSLGPQAIRSIAAGLPPPSTPGSTADKSDPPPGATRLSRALWDACRAQARPRLDDLALRIPPAARWPDLVLPEDQLETLREIASHVRQRTRVYTAWGFAGKSARGLGISALFAGPSGTGKTMAAEVLANELDLDLYHIDLSAVVSKYIGETEKNLRRVFDAAEQGGAILLFDEADAIFGKRSEVKDSHDRYANLEVSYLLQRMEAYRGLAILTTNMRESLDPAFLRRLRFVVQFPFPDAAHRAEIWRRIFPQPTPTTDLDPDRLARLNIAGGNIRNIALSAAFLAADEARPVDMTHLLRAARSEYAKLEKPLTAAEIGGWL